MYFFNYNLTKLTIKKTKVLANTIKVAKTRKQDHANRISNRRQNRKKDEA